jgi:hypothetical protein
MTDRIAHWAKTDRHSAQLEQLPAIPGYRYTQYRRWFGGAALLTHRHHLSQLQLIQACAQCNHPLGPDDGESRGRG